MLAVRVSGDSEGVRVVGDDAIPTASGTDSATDVLKLDKPMGDSTNIKSTQILSSTAALS